MTDIDKSASPNACPNCPHEHEHEHEHAHNHPHKASSCGSGAGAGSCSCSESGHSHDEPASRRDILLWSSGVLLFIIALLADSLPVYIPKLLIASLYLVSTLIAGYSLLFKGVKEIFSFKLEENSLLLIAVVASFVLGEYPEACVVVLLFRLGSFLESYAVNRSRKSTEALTAIRPDFATIKDENGEFKQIPAAAASVGVTLYIRPGDRVALDCEILSGASSVDASALTGEAVPINVEKGDTLLSGSINLNGLLEARVTKSFENSTASQIIEMVYASSAKKGKAENLVSRFARIYTPIVVLLALLIAVVPPLLSLGSFHDFIMRALIFLVASCPCSLVISIPLTFFSGIGAASKMGVLVKGSMYLEMLAKINAVALDKTGTLTSGRLEIAEIFPQSNSNELLQIAYSLEAASTHPIASSITAHANAMGINESLAITDLTEAAGYGISASYNGSLYRCGGVNMLKKHKIKIPDTAANVYICKDESVIGGIILKEELSKDSINLVEALKNEAVPRVVMLTGDNKDSAKAVAEQCGITEFYAGLLPADKVTQLKKIKENGAKVLFVGDGINDAPVLAEADLGISMGLGSEIANASSDIVLASNRLSALPRAISLAKRCMSIVGFNLIFAFSVKAVVLILGATGLGTMWLAVFADIGVTILSVINSMRILKVKK